VLTKEYIFQHWYHIIYLVQTKGDVDLSKSISIHETALLSARYWNSKHRIIEADW